MPSLETTSNDFRELTSLAETYFDAAYDMDADKFASLFHEQAAITRMDESGALTVTPVAGWLDAVRTMASPRGVRAEREDRILSINLGRDMALVQLRLRVPPREVTDLLSCFRVDGRWRIAQKVFEAAIPR